MKFMSGITPAIHKQMFFFSRLAKLAVVPR